MPDLKDAKILVADVPAGLKTLRKILGEEPALIPATTVEDALTQLANAIDGILCGIHFDESRMFDLLRFARARELSRSVPIVCYRDLESELTPTLFESLDIACKALGAHSFIDLHTLRRRFGADHADGEFRRIVMASLEGRRP